MVGFDLATSEHLGETPAGADVSPEVHLPEPVLGMGEPLSEEEVLEMTLRRCEERRDRCGRMVDSLCSPSNSDFATRPGGKLLRTVQKPNTDHAEDDHEQERDMTRFTQRTTGG